MAAVHGNNTKDSNRFSLNADLGTNVFSRF